jgi:hypothetical protein
MPDSPPPGKTTTKTDFRGDLLIKYVYLYLVNSINSHLLVHISHCDPDIALRDPENNLLKSLAIIFQNKPDHLIEFHAHL